MRFDELLTNEDVLDGLWDMHFDECTPIQEQTIPLVLEGRDLIACAQTGTGKTAAYLLPVINQLADGKYPEDAINCVVMAPTRELAQQIDRQLQGFAYFMPVSGIAVYGGTDGLTYEQQRKSLKMGADVVIATPGRLLAHLSMGYVDLSRTSFFILDEADRMLDMGFYDDIMQIFSQLPDSVQVLMFSATMPPKIQQMAKKILKDPAEVKIAVSKPADNIDQSAYICYETQKLPLVRKIFDDPPKKVIIFSSSKLKVKNLARELKKLKFNIGEMHSDLEQEKRDQVMTDFKAGNLNVIVATDIISRGIDIDDIELVINFDVPRDAEDYVHRIGRTARAHRDGRAVTLVSPEDFPKLARIEKLLEKPIPKNDVPEELGETPVFSVSKSKINSTRRKGRKRSSHAGFMTKDTGRHNKITKSGSLSKDKSNKKKDPTYNSEKMETQQIITGSSDTALNAVASVKPRKRRRKSNMDSHKNTKADQQD